MNNNKFEYTKQLNEIWNVFVILYPQFAVHSEFSGREKQVALCNGLKWYGHSVSIDVSVIHREKGELVAVNNADLVVDCRSLVVVLDDPAGISIEHYTQGLRCMEDLRLAAGVILNFGDPKADLKTWRGRRKLGWRMGIAKNDPEQAMELLAMRHRRVRR